MSRKPTLSRQRMTSFRAGFTLVEMLIVVTIVGLLASVVIPTLSSTSGAVALEATAASSRASVPTSSRHLRPSWHSTMLVQVRAQRNGPPIGVEMHAPGASPSAGVSLQSGTSFATPIASDSSTHSFVIEMPRSMP